MADDKVSRYRRAMNDAFQQLDWCIGYFQGSNKPHIALALSKNRRHIAKDVAGIDETELPTEKSTKAAKE